MADTTPDNTNCVFIKKKKKAKGNRENNRKRTAEQIAVQDGDEEIIRSNLQEKRGKMQRGIGATSK